MSIFMTQIVLGAYVLFGLSSVTAWVLMRNTKIFLFEIAFGLGFFWLLHLGTGFPTARLAFGGPSYLLTVCLVLLAIVLGIVGHYFFFEKKVNWTHIFKTLFISPVLLIPLIGSVQGVEEITEFQLVSLMLLGYQNGFFWKEFYRRIQKEFVKGEN
jgi:ABC-type antimicrobial peptide transport system permease subunit